MRKADVDSDFPGLSSALTSRTQKSGVPAIYNRIISILSQDVTYIICLNDVTSLIVPCPHFAEEGVENKEENIARKCWLWVPARGAPESIHLTAKLWYFSWGVCV